MRLEKNENYTEWEERKLCFFTDDRSDYIENLKELTTKKNVVDLLCNYSKDAEYKVNMQIQVLSYILVTNK